MLVIQGTVVSAEHVSTHGEPLNLKEFIRSFELPVIVGGCASYTTALHLMRTGAVGVLVGVGPGNACTSRGVLGIGVPQATAIADAAAARMEHLRETGRYCHVIADGGMRTGGDIAKAIACGADAVMIGSPLTRAYEAPGRGYHWGMATFHPTLPRGARVKTQQVASLEEILDRARARERRHAEPVRGARDVDGDDRLRHDPRVPEGRARDRAVDQDRGQDVPIAAARRDGALSDPRPAVSAAAAKEHPNPVLVVDLGAQYAQLIARRVRECHVYSEIVPHDLAASELAARRPAGIILSGGPASVYEEGAPSVDPALFDLGVPVLGICYGHQLMARDARRRGRRDRPARVRGRRAPRATSRASLLRDLASDEPVWMSHGDAVTAGARRASASPRATDHDPDRVDGGSGARAGSPCSSTRRWRTRRRGPPS